MVPAGRAVDDTIEKLLPLLSSGDIVIDGGNSFYKDSVRRYGELKANGIGYLDAGISGGMEGARNGACAMIGGDKEIYDCVADLFRLITVENGSLYTGPAGSGHFAKMVHNGIEYGMLQAIGEGFELLESVDFSYDYAKIAKLWNNGSVIRGWLMSLAEDAFKKSPELSGIRGIMNSNGEGLWAAQTALNLGVPAPVITQSVIMRQRSQQEDSFAGKVVAALRNEFGGHTPERKK
jgi:6-phosphogluconate dehydrogenase